MGLWQHRGQRDNWLRSERRLHTGLNEGEEPATKEKGQLHFGQGHSQAGMHRSRRHNVLAEQWDVHVEYALCGRERPQPEEKVLNAISKFGHYYTSDGELWRSLSTENGQFFILEILFCAIMGWNALKGTKYQATIWVNLMNGLSGQISQTQWSAHFIILSVGNPGTGKQIRGAWNQNSGFQWRKGLSERGACWFHGCVHLAERKELSP